MKLENPEFTAQAIYNWCKALGTKKYKHYIKPELMVRHYISRPEWVLDDPVKDEGSVPSLPPHDSVLRERA